MINYAQAKGGRDNRRSWKKMNEELELTLEEIETHYVGQWVLVEETAWDKQGNPTRGAVVAHGFDRQALVQPTQRLHTQKPAGKTFAFYAGPKIPEGLVVVL